MMAPGENVAKPPCSMGVITAALGVWQPFWSVYIWIVPVLVKNIAICIALVSLNFVFCSNTGKIQGSNAIADIRKMIPNIL